MSIATGPAYAHGDIVQDQSNGWFFRIIEDGMATQLSASGDIDVRDIVRPVVLCHADGTPTGHGDMLATRIAVGISRRWRPETEALRVAAFQVDPADAVAVDRCAQITAVR